MTFKKGHKHSEETKKRIGNANRKPIYFYCDYCCEISITTTSKYKRKKKHFCSTKCYALFRKELMPFFEQNTYKGIRKQNETKQVYHRNYYKNNPTNISHLKARRYAREKGADGSHTLDEWKEIKAAYNWCCAGCGHAVELTKDHIIPLSEGGTDYAENIQPLCRSCNSKKWKHIYENPEMLT